MKLIGMIRGTDGETRDVLADEPDYAAARDVIEKRVAEGDELLSLRQG